MSLTFLELQNKVLGWLDETTDNTTVLANVKESLAQHNVRRALQNEWRFLQTTDTISVTPNNRTYALPADFDKLVYIYDRTHQTPLEEISTRGLDVTTAPWLQTNDGSRFTLRGGQLELLYIPATSATLEIQYIRQPTELSADGDFPDIPYPYSRILIWDTLLDLALYNEDLDTTAGKVNLWSQYRDDLEAALFASQLEGNSRNAQPTFVRVTDDDAAF